MDELRRPECTLFVPPCGKSLADNIQFRLYYCLAERTVREARYIGMYKGKSVRAIGRIAKVVICNVSVDVGTVDVLDVELGPKENLTVDEQKRIVGAARNAPSFEWDIRHGHKFYLCDEMNKTAFQKISRCGMQNVRYFDLEKVLGGDIPNDLTQLANQLQRFTWE